MRLSDESILDALEQNRIVIEPPPHDVAVSGCTVDLRLGQSFRVFTGHTAPFIDCSSSSQEIANVIDKVMSPELTVDVNGYFYLHPGQLALGVTEEFITIPNDLVGWLDGRSSLARLGLMVHVTAHRIDPGWSGRIVLEFVNAGHLPLALKPGMKIAALSFESLTTPATIPYNKRLTAKYKGQATAVASRLEKE